MSNNNRFQLDLEFGKIYERKLTQIVPNDKSEIMEGYFPDYDVIITKDNKETTYEVKSDRLAYKTGNMAIEFKHNNKPSGISITKAEYYAYFIVKPYNLFELYIIPVQVLKDKIKASEYKRITFTGSNVKTDIYVFGIDLFNEYKINV